MVQASSSSTAIEKPPKTAAISSSESSVVPITASSADPTVVTLDSQRKASGESSAAASPRAAKSLASSVSVSVSGRGSMSSLSTLSTSTAVSINNSNAATVSTLNATSQNSVFTAAQSKDSKPASTSLPSASFLNISVLKLVSGDKFKRKPQGTTASSSSSATVSKRTNRPLHHQQPAVASSGSERPAIFASSFSAAPSWKSSSSEGFRVVGELSPPRSNPSFSYKKGVVSVAGHKRPRTDSISTTITSTTTTIVNIRSGNLCYSQDSCEHLANLLQSPEEQTNSIPSESSITRDLGMIPDSMVQGRSKQPKTHSSVLMHEQASRPPSSRLSQFEQYTQSLRPSESTSSSHVTTSGSSHSKIHQIRSLAHFRELIGTTKQDSLYPHHDMDPLIVMEFTAPWCIP